MLLILCASIFLNRTLSLSGLIELVLCIVHMFEIKGATQYGVCPLSARPYFSFYGGTCSFAPIIFECKKKHGPCVHDAQTIFLFPTIILLAEVATYFSVVAHNCSLFAVCSLILSALFLILAG